MEVISQRDDGTFVLLNSADAVADIKVGGPAVPTVGQPRFYTPRMAKVPLAAADTGGGILSWQNTTGQDIIIYRLVLDVTTKTTSACTADSGTTTVGATTSSDNLIDGLDIGTSAGTFDNIQDKGTNGRPRQKLASGKWITISMASGAAAGLVGFAYLEYHPL